MSENNNNNYSNFNEYQQPAQPIFIQPDDSAQKAEDASSANAFGIWSLVCSIVLCCCCGIGPIIGLILSILGLKKQKGNALCIVALIISCVLVFIYAVRMISAGTALAETDWSSIMQDYEQMMQDPDGYMEQYAETYGAFIRF